MSLGVAVMGHVKQDFEETQKGVYFVYFEVANPVGRSKTPSKLSEVHQLYFEID